MMQADATADLMLGETLLYSWGISARSFLIRVGAIVGIWVILGQIGSFGQSLSVTLPGAVVFGLFYMWVFGELNLWAQHRDTNWHLTDRAIHIVPGDDLPARLPLSEIHRITHWPLWSLVVRFNVGTATTLPIPPRPKELRQRILAARAKVIPEGTA